MQTWNNKQQADTVLMLQRLIDAVELTGAHPDLVREADTLVNLLQTGDGSCPACHVVGCVDPLHLGDGPRAQRALEQIAASRGQSVADVIAGVDPDDDDGAMTREGAFQSESGFPDRFGHYPGSDNLGESEDH